MKLETQTHFIKLITMTFCIVYLASPREFHYVGRLRIDMLRLSMTRTKQLFPDTDIFVFHEDYTESDKESLPPVKEYIQVDFSGEDEHYNPETNRRKGYLMMCRFFCGPLQSYPQLQNYTHYIRLDDDSLFLEPFVTPKRIEELSSYDYIYRTLYNEQPCIPTQTIWDFTLEFLRKQKVQEWDIELMKKTLDQRYLMKDGTWANNVPYNNFHFSSLALWRHPLVKKYIDAIEAEKGVLKYGWFDASIHAMVALVLPWFTRAKVGCDSTWGYRHNGYISQMYGTAFERVADDFFPTSL
jgi:hypothetical protein